MTTHDLIVLCCPSCPCCNDMAAEQDPVWPCLHSAGKPCEISSGLAWQGKERKICWTKNVLLLLFSCWCNVTGPRKGYLDFTFHPQGVLTGLHERLTDVVGSHDGEETFSLTCWVRI